VVRLVTWNCRVGGFRYKSERIASLLPDVAAVQEVEPIGEVLVFGGANQPTFRDRLEHPKFRRGIGVFSYTGVQLEVADADEPVPAFRRYTASLGGLAFQVVAVWTAAATPGRHYKQAIEGARAHRDWMCGMPTVVLGDFNDNASYASTNWPELMAALEPVELVSAYHTFFGEEFGRESRPTHFYKGSRESAWHLDYCFIPASWADRIRSVHVGTYAEWHEYSDHVPLVVDLDLPIG
jgi:endonuclease/exonuclease/phosphatase family metal-dependent hydrolase